MPELHVVSKCWPLGHDRAYRSSSNRPVSGNFLDQLKAVARKSRRPGVRQGNGFVIVRTDYDRGQARRLRFLELTGNVRVRCAGLRHGKSLSPAWRSVGEAHGRVALSQVIGILVGPC